MIIGICTYASLIDTKEFFYKLGANVFSYDPRLANSYRIHSYGKDSYESNASERKKSIGS
jgi:hypothetical protein